LFFLAAVFQAIGYYNEPITFPQLICGLALLQAVQTND
jgi:hypothetical protein